MGNTSQRNREGLRENEVRRYRKAVAEREREVKR
jgi:hypothetical protein